MKAAIDKENYLITLDNEAVKAIRFCYGLNPDLRVSLRLINKRLLWKWLSDNEIQLFGLAMLDLHPSRFDKDWDRYEYMIDDVVEQIIR